MWVCTVGVWGRCVCGCVQLGYGVGVYVGVYSWGMWVCTVGVWGRCICGSVQLGYGVGV